MVLTNDDGRPLTERGSACTSRVVNLGITHNNQFKPLPAAVTKKPKNTRKINSSRGRKKNHIWYKSTQVRNACTCEAPRFLAVPPDINAITAPLTTSTDRAKRADSQPERHRRKGRRVHGGTINANANARKHDVARHEVKGADEFLRSWLLEL